MKRKIITILLCSPIFLFSQSKQDSVYQNVVMKVYQNINDYKSNSSLAGSWAQEDFIKMFESSETKIVNDIPLFSEYNTKVTTEEYISRFSRKYNKIGVSIKITSIGRIDFDDESYNTGELKVKVTKSLYGPSNNKIKVPTYNYQCTVCLETFNSPTDNKCPYCGSAKFAVKVDKDSERKLEYKDDVNLIITYKFNRDTLLKISDISLDGPPKGELILAIPKVYTVFNKTPSFYPPPMKLTKDGKEFSVNSFFFAIPNIDKNTNIIFEPQQSDLYRSFEVTYNTLKEIEEDRTFIMKFRKTVGSYYGSLGTSVSAIRISDNNFELSGARVSSYGGGAYFKLNELKKNPFKSLQKHDLTLNVGAEKSIIKYTIDMQNNVVSYTDNDGELDYLREVTLNGLQEEQNIDLTNLFVKVGYTLDKENINWVSKISFLPDNLLLLGGVGYSMVNSGTYNSTASANYTGYYKDLFGVTLDGTYDEYNFGSDNLVEGAGDLDLVESAIYLSLEVNGNWQFSNIFIKAGPSFNYYLNDLTDSDNSRIHSQSNDLSNSNINELKTVNHLIDQISFNNLMFNVSIHKKF